MSYRAKYYRVLGLEPGASIKEIRSAYRKMVLLYHPDRNPDKNTEDQFLRIQEAYDILTNKVAIPFSNEDAQERLRKRRQAEERRREERKKRYERIKQKRREHEKKQVQFAGKLMAATIGAVSLFSLILNLPSLLENRQLKRNGITQVATLIDKSAPTEPDKMLVSFNHMGQDWITTVARPNNTTISWWLEPGDRFLLKYNIKNPEMNRIDWNKPNLTTQNRFINAHFPNYERNEPILPPDALYPFLDSIGNRFGLYQLEMFTDFSTYQSIVSPPISTFLFDKNTRTCWSIRQHFINQSQPLPNAVR